MKEAERRKQSEAQEKTDGKLIVIIAGALAMNATAQATASKLSGPLGIPTVALIPILLLAKSKPITYGIATLPSAGGSSEASALEATYRAHYVLVGSRRVQAALGRNASVQEAMVQERPNFDLHIKAMHKRMVAAKAVDVQAAKHGDELGWYTKMDNRTSAECKQANGKNFQASRIPAIGYPGSVHPYCRCKAGRPHNTSQTVYSIKPEAA